MFGNRGTVFTPTYVNSTQELVIGESFGQPIPPNSTTFGELLTLYPDVPSKGSCVTSLKYCVGLS
jgi:hypothetical protein